jgi:hypothetical protein
MTKRHPPFQKSPAPQEVRDSLPVADLPTQIDSWLLAGDISRHSPRTLETRRERMNSLVWFLNHREYEVCGLTELRAFFHYLNHGHKEPGGRWGNPRCTRPVTP